MLKREIEYKKMQECESNLWWYKNLKDLVLNSLKQNFDKNFIKNVKILDAGCGTGGLMTFLKENNFENISGFDISEYALEFCRQKGLDVFKGDISNLEVITENFDAIISNDTLYFFEPEEQNRIIKNFYNLLNSNGILLLNLPALKAFKGLHDDAVGIKKRFEVSDIEKIIYDSGFCIKNVIFWPFLLSPIIFFSRLVQRIKKILNPNTPVVSDVEMLPQILNSIFYNLIKFENKFLKKKPFGSSIFLVLKKSNSRSN